MQSRDLTIRLQTLGQKWDVCGVDRARGVYPENVVATANRWGSDVASFDLKRDPGSTWPDLSAFTPVEIESGGEVVWSGRIKETPSKDGLEKVINVQCEGTQYHLDDDVFEKLYVHSGLGDFKDIRSFLGADLTHFPSGATVSTDNRAITLGFPTDINFPGNSSFVGVMIDLGPFSRYAAIAVDWDQSNNQGSQGLIVSTRSDELVPAPPATNVINIVNNTGVSQSQIGAVVTPVRYALIVGYYTSPTPATQINDGWWKIKAVRMFGDYSYQVAGQSVLTADVVIKDALNIAAPLLSDDQTAISPVSFVIPELSTGEPKTPREVIEAVNAYHDYITKIDVTGRMIFKPKPTAPTIEVGAWSAMEINDASANSGEDIYTRVIVTTESPAGEKIRVIRNATVATIPATRGFGRTKILQVQSALPTDGIAAAQIGDTWLAAHTATPFKGTVTLTGNRSVRGVLSGAAVPLQSLLGQTGELLRFSDRVDPDSGGIGYDGRIAAVSYDFAKDEATVTIDNSRASFEALLSRLAVVTGAG